MKKLISAIILVLIVASPRLITAQSLNEVLENHFEAIGQKKLKKVETITTKGKINQMGIDVPFVQISVRPNLFRVQGTFQGLSFIQTYNGVEGWTVNPFAGTTEPEPIPADQLKELKIQADMDGMLWQWEDKGFNVTLDSTEDVEGTLCYRVKVVVPEGSTYINFIDKESFLLIKTNTKSTIMGTEVEGESFYSNYMQIDGITFPGKIENRYNGVTSEVILIEGVELNKEYASTLFDKSGTTVVTE